MLRTTIVGLLFFAFVSLSLADDTNQAKLDFSKAWFKPELIENHDSICSDVLKDAEDKFFTNQNLLAAYNAGGVGVEGLVIAESEEGGGPLVTEDDNTWSFMAFNKKYYMEYYRHGGCGGACETYQILISNSPLRDSEDSDTYKAAVNNSPAPVPYGGLRLLHSEKDSYYLSRFDDSKLDLYQLQPDATWKNLCKITFKPSDVSREKFQSVLASINQLKSTVGGLRRGAGSCGSMGTHWHWGQLIDSSLDQALYRPWALTMSKDYPSANSYGDYKRISQQLEAWSLNGISEYKALLAYKAQLKKSIDDISVFYQKENGWPEQQSKVMAEEALTSAISRGFGFYMYDPQFATGEEELRKSILEKKNINEIKSIQFDVKNIDSQTTRWGGGPESQESILNISVDYPDALKFLLDKGVDPDKSNGFGKTPLMYAAQYDQIDSAKMLIDHEANTVAATANPGDSCYYTLKTYKMTPLHYAVRYASPDFIKLLLDNGAEPFMRAENRRKYPMVEETPLDWLHRYTAADSPEKNPNIPDDKTAEVEKWLQPLSVEELSAKVQDYIVAAEKEYEQGKIPEAYRNIIKAVEIQPDNERALSDMSLLALKHGDLGVSLETSDKLIKRNSDSKAIANAWFNYGLACEEYKSSGKWGPLSYNGQYYCQESPAYFFLKAWQTEKTSARANKLVDLFKTDELVSCNVKLTDNNEYKVHFTAAEKKRKIYFFYKNDNKIDINTVYWIRKSDPKNHVKPELVGVSDLGNYSIAEMETQDYIEFPLYTQGLACWSESAKAYAEGTTHPELHVIGIYESSDPSGNHIKRWWERCMTTGTKSCKNDLGELGGPVVINIRQTNKTIILFLSSWTPTRWVIKNPSKAKIEKVILSQNDYIPKITGLDESVPVEVYASRVHGPCDQCRKGGFIAAYHEYPRELDGIVGFLPSSYQRQEVGEEFSVPPLMEE